MALASGSRVGPYEILSPAGAGGMGEVYRARDGRLHREIAIKSLPPPRFPRIHYARTGRGSLCLNRAVTTSQNGGPFVIREGKMRDVVHRLPSHSVLHRVFRIR